MEDPTILKDIITWFGPLGFGWGAALYLAWKYWGLLNDYHTAIVESTKVIEHLTVIIEERTRNRDK